ncbi:MAG: hypothetical protein ACOC22_03955 [bacterium]
MLIFLISTIVVSIIAYCFLKKDFWEQRLLVLLVIGLVTLVGNTTTGLVVKDNLERNVRLDRSDELHYFYVHDSLFVDSMMVLKPSCKFEFKTTLNDTIDKNEYRKTPFVLGELHGETKVLLINNDALKDDEIGDYDLNRFVIKSNELDTIHKDHYLSYYDTDDNIWVDEFLYLPFSEYYHELSLPEKYVNLIPDSLQTKNDIKKWN